MLHLNTRNHTMTHHQELTTRTISFQELSGAVWLQRIPEIQPSLLFCVAERQVPPAVKSLQYHHYSDFALYTRLAPKPLPSLQPDMPSLQVTSPVQTFPNLHICLNPSRAPCLHLFSSSLPPGTVSICTPLSSTLLLPLPLPLCWRSFMSEPIAMVTGNLLDVSSPGSVNEGV